MRGTRCWSWRLTPTKFIAAIFVFVVILNWFYVSYNYSHNPMGVAIESKHMASVAKDNLSKRIQILVWNGFRISRINQNEKEATIYLTKNVRNLFSREELLRPTNKGNKTEKVDTLESVKTDLKVNIKHSQLDSNNREVDSQSNFKKHQVDNQSDLNNREVDNQSDLNNREVDNQSDLNNREVDNQSDLNNRQVDNQSDLNEDHIEENATPDPPINGIIHGCPNNTIHHEGMTSYGSCKPHQPTPESCQEAARLFQVDPQKCEAPFRGDICSLDVTLLRGMKLLTARCNRLLCLDRRFGFVVKTLNHDSGAHDVVHRYSTLKDLERDLPRVIKNSHLNGYNYVFLECKGRHNAKISQLLPLDPRFTIKESRNQRSQNLLNVNILFLDSVSRPHFYRSLPKTIKAFKRMATGPTHPTPARVFDFELFQALEGHTAENEHALFTGKLFPPTSDRERIRPVGMEKLFGSYKRAGYQTMWQEDLCWTGGWGLFTDLALNYYYWNLLAPKLSEVHIDHTGLTHSSCEVLKSYGLNSPFQGPSGNRICYNGKYQHSYFLNYNLKTLQAIAANKKSLPLLSYIPLNVGHDMYGKRIQTIDHDLAQFVESMAKESNTLTIILADHGNTYTRYTVTTQEGQFEMFHPSLFIIVPDQVAKLLGAKALDALQINQRRLVTMIDLHHSLMALAGSISPTGVGPRGVFTPISSKRTCNNVELRTPNLCVCEGWDSPTTNDTLKLAFAEFAVGQLNNKLLASQGSGLALLRSCNRLQPTRFVNVRERNTKDDGGSLITSMDLILAAGDAAPQREDVFHVEVQSKRSSSKESLNMKFVHYERLTAFAVYGACADQGVNKKLCICSRRKKTLSRGRLKELVRNNSRHFGATHVELYTLDDGCLVLIKRVHGKDDAHAYEVANTCTDRPRTVLLTISHVSNMKVSRDGPIRITVSPGSIMFGLSAMKEVQPYDGSITVQGIPLE